MQKTSRILRRNRWRQLPGMLRGASLGSADFESLRIAYSLKIDRARSGARGGFQNLRWSGRSYSQLEFVVCGFLPAMNLAGETRYH